MTDTRPVLLDLFCGAGGAAMGYHRAGFHVIGIDIAPQPRYPFEMRVYDVALLPLRVLRGADAVHASPPCQKYSCLKAFSTKDHPQMIEQTRELFDNLNVPWVIENVPGAPLIDPIRLCGTMFDLKVYRHRLFESSIDLIPPTHPRHEVTIGSHRKVKKNDQGWVSANGGGHWVEDGRAAMDIPWMIQRELAQAIPPAYTECIGRQLINHLYQVILPTGTRKENQ